jgi:hypothetical protein
MSRTKRNIKPNAFLRNPKTTNTRRAEHYAAMDLDDEGFSVNSHVSKRANLKSGAIKTAYDDMLIAAQSIKAFLPNLLI